jgi:hypothetical protein
MRSPNARSGPATREKGSYHSVKTSQIVNLNEILLKPEKKCKPWQETAKVVVNNPFRSIKNGK